MPVHKNLLDAERTNKRPSLRKPRSIAAACMICGTFLLLILAMEMLKDRKTNHIPLIYIPLLPVLAAGAIAAVIPLVMFLSYQEDFEKLNPLIPSHYLFLAKKTMYALKTNNWKVSAKDL